MRRSAAAASPTDFGPGAEAGDPGGEPVDEVGRMFVGDGPTMGRGYERIVHHLFKVDEWGEYEDLEKRLRLGKAAHRAEHAELMDACEESQDCARRAHRLYCNAAVALEGYRSDVEAVEATLRERARRTLEEEKDAGTRRKTITDADVRAQMADSYPDQVRDHDVRLAKAKRMVDHFERLADLWKSRCRTLETLLLSSKR